MAQPLHHALARVGFSVYPLRVCKIGDSMRDMHKSGSLSRNSTGSNNNTNSNTKASALRLSSPQQSLRRLGLCSQIATGEHSSPIVFPEKRGKVKASRKSSEVNAPTTARPDDQDAAKNFEHRIDIGGGGGGDEKSDLLGYVVFSGKLVLDKRKITVNNNSDAQQTSFDITNQEAVDAKLTSKALLWGSQVLHLDDVISVIHCFYARWMVDYFCDKLFLGARETKEMDD